MAEDTHKINVRSPFFITATGEGAPDIPDAVDDPIDDPVVPEEYVQPETLTQTVLCGETINVGEDVGGRIYKLQVGSATGDVTINYSVNTPISITGYWDTSTPDFSSTGYVGNDDFEQNLLDAGIEAGNMNLGSGVQTGTVTINKAGATPETVNVLVSAPLPTDDYSLTFNCPSAPTVTAPTLPDPPSLTNATLVDVVPAFYAQYVDNANIEMRVNGVLIQHQSTDYIGTDRYYAFSDFSIVGSYAIGQSYETRTVVNSVETQTTPTTYLAKSTYFNTDVNKVEFTITPISSQRYATVYLYYQKGGIVYDDRIADFRYIKYTQSDLNYFNIVRGFVGDSAIQAFGGHNISTLSKPVKIEFYYRETPLNQSGLDHPRRPALNQSTYVQGRCFGEISEGVEEIGILAANRIQ